MNLPEKWDVNVKSSVWKGLKKFPQSDAARITDAILLLPDNPYAGDTRKIKDEDNKWRRRVGSYRISFELYPDRRLVVVVEVKRRTSNTY